MCAAFEVNAVKLSEAIEAFLDSHRVEQRSEVTIRTHADRLNLFLRWAGDAELSALTPQRMRSYLRHLQERKDMRARNSEGRTLSPETVADHYLSMRAFLNWSVADKLIADTPLANVKKPETPTRMVPALNAKDMQRVLEFWSPHTDRVNRKYAGLKRARFLATRNRAIIWLLTDSGLRLAELISLDHDSFDWAHRRVRFVGKGDRQREVPFSMKTSRAMRVYSEAARQMFGGNGSGPFFLTLAGQRISRESIRGMFETARDMLGLKGKFSPHVLRHTAATMMRNNGADLIHVQATLGHSNLNTTRRYFTVTPEQLSKDHDRVSPLNGPVTER